MEIITRLDGRLSRILAMVPSFEGGKPALIFRCDGAAQKINRVKFCKKNFSERKKSEKNAK
jgi:hypothetical protein